MTQSTIEILLKQSIGFESSSIGSSSINRSIRRRMNELEITDIDTYSALIHSSREELELLIEEVVIPETWFFRNEAAFKVMQQFVLSEWRAAHPAEVLRILCLPCSTGEEPYSVAMALMDGGLSPDEFHIDAVDISSRALAKARRGVYGKNSFRGNSLKICEHYFKKTEAGFSIDKSVRNTVNFQNGNIFDDDFMQSLKRYSVIFCRNLLIYFDESGCSSTARTLAGLLKDDGMLFVGHAENGWMWSGLFTFARYPMAFAYRKSSDDQGAKRTLEECTQIKPRRLSRIKRQFMPIKRRRTLAECQKDTGGGDSSKKTGKHGEAVEKGLSLDAAHEFANSGRVDDAAMICKNYLSSKGASAKAYFILGLISDTLKDTESAKKYFQKTLYLEPDHYESLVHLALILEQDGDTEGALRLKRRVERVYTKNHGSSKKVSDE